MPEAFDTEGQSERWFAVRVKSNRENVVLAGLAGKGYQSFLPTFQTQTARKALAERPLFPGYVFSRFQIHRRLPILMMPGVVHIVGIGKVPLPIDEEEISSLRLAVSSRLPIAPVEYTTGAMVRVEAGPLAGAVGTVSGRKSDLLVVSITLLRRSVAVELRPEWLTRVSEHQQSQGDARVA